MISRSLLRQSISNSSRPRPLYRLLPSTRPSHTSSHRLSPLPLTSRLPARCYSSKPESATEDSSSEGIPATEGTQEEDPARKELETKNQEIIELKDKYLRSVADFRNLQDRTKREVTSARDFAISRFAKDLLESVDNLDRALDTVPKDKLEKEDSNKDLANLYDGLKMTEKILMQTLKKHGLERFDPSAQAERFDPNLHEATFMTKMDDKEDGTVFMTQQKGFLLNGRVVRAAKVGVVKNS